MHLLHILLCIHSLQASANQQPEIRIYGHTIYTLARCRYSKQNETTRVESNSQATSHLE